MTHTHTHTDTHTYTHTNTQALKGQSTKPEPDGLCDAVPAPTVKSLGKDLQETQQDLDRNLYPHKHASC